MTTDQAGPGRAVMWFRRDLRLTDNPALLDACAGEGVLPLFVLDPALWDPAGGARRAYLAASLRALDSSLRERQARLCLRAGDPVRTLVDTAREIGAVRVHVAEDFAPYGVRRDRAVEQALGRHGIALVRTGSPYAVSPGRVRTGQRGPYQVFTPFARAWHEHGWRQPVDAPTRATWLEAEGRAVPDVEVDVELPGAGERAALRRWRDFLGRVGDYDDGRDRPGVEGTSRMSVHLRWGEIHPRTMLSDLAARSGRHSRDSRGIAAYRTELAWREFHADVLARRPDTAREYLRPEFATMEYDEPGARFDAWRGGRTGYPIVDAGMRQLAAAGWMHNRVRMITASFLVKDLHVEWQHGARHFMRHLVDGDLASNQHNWQWVAGCGTDAAPYFRVFNPTLQGRRFDPDGHYVRRWVPELRGVADRWVHEPAAAPGRPPEGYPAPIVEHAAERREALARLEQIKK